MKKNILKVILMSLALAVVACGKEENPGPEVITLSFFESMYAGDFESAKKYASVKTMATLGMIEKLGVKEEFMQKVNESNVNFQVLQSKIVGKKAICIVKMSSNKEKDKNMPIDLIRRDGAWLVDFNKERMGQ